jgi:hypothetical protein
VPTEQERLRIAAAESRAGMRWALAASLTLHAVLSLIFAWPGTRQVLPPIEEGLPVEVWSPNEFDALTSANAPEGTTPVLKPPLAASGSEAASSLPEQERTAPAPQAAVPAVGSVIAAKKILSNDVLADPSSRQAQAMLPQLDPETRWEQLCDIEAMAQIAVWHKEFQPDRVVAYALGEVKAVDHKIVAEGAAFRSQRRWFKLRFTCEIAADRDAVLAFAFAVGTPIPRSSWERYGLPPVH